VAGLKHSTLLSKGMRMNCLATMTGLWPCMPVCLEKGRRCTTSKPLPVADEEASRNEYWICFSSVVSVLREVDSLGVSLAVHVTANDDIIS